MATKPKKKDNTGKVILIILGVAALGVGGYFLWKKFGKKKPETRTEEEKAPKKELERVNPAEIIQKTMNNLNFRSGKATIENQSYDSLEDLADWLIANPTARLHIVGHTDSQGDDLANLKLSKARAKAVRDFIVSEFPMKMPSERVTFDGKGENEPIADNKTSKGREQNRRVEFIIS